MEEKEKEKTRPIISYFLFIVVGIIGLINRLAYSDFAFDTIWIFKLGISIALIVFGLWKILKK